MRTRYYNPTIKWFMSQDTLLGSITNSQSLNRYAFVNGNPISSIDPFGLCGESSKDFIVGNVASIDDNMNFGIAQGLAGYRPNIDSTAFKVGKVTGDVISIYAGFASAAAGTGGEVIGVGIDITGDGALVGAPINVAIASAITYGGDVIAKGTIGLVTNSLNLFSSSGSSGGNKGLKGEWIQRRIKSAA